MKNIGIIGGGASGLTAAIVAAKCGNKVTILEHKDRVGKKILLTGSGKCNISNLDMNENHFHSSYEDNITHEFIRQLFVKCPPSEVRDFISSLGIYLKDRNGYLYPYSENAGAVVDSLRFAAEDIGVQTLTNSHVNKIIKKDKSDNFKVLTNNGAHQFDRIIICCGSKAYEKTGSDGSGYKLSKDLGHSLVKPLPALTYLNCQEDYYPSIAGIRIKAKVSLFDFDLNRELANDIGELQINKTGISGIPVFNISYIAAKSLDRKRSLKACIDFIPDLSKEQLFEVICQKIKNYPNRTLEELLIGILHKNLGMLIIKRCNLRLKDVCSSLNNEKINAISNMIKNFDTKIISTGSFDNSQVASGGIDILELDANMQSKKTKGIYYAGEIIDINGDCGGYNLHFAFTTAIVAGRSV